ncbi:hypothetical protein F3J23_16605 [Chryseobacterium sp. Tr-659]|uniref:S41 family peptidase n=1 Tax=Chryseobacterium sp. Tr-659 TaxID=2608340 RepID=UPI0014227670|nr:S41 family peptidase [Chryseobacterium sp. Tr-659]NIF07060.1 hypothetical protein [Chryseobacterium sp. Tr-659]
MKNLFLIIFLALLSISCNSQNNKDYNFGFETKTRNNSLPEGWYHWGNIIAKNESALFQAGKKSVIIQSPTQASEGGISYTLFNIFQGKELRLEGYVKTEKVENSAGLFISLARGDQQPLGSNEIKTENVHGTTDWKKYTITLPITENQGTLQIGGFLKGKGKVWFDSFKVYVDGTNIETIASEGHYQSADEFLLDSQFKIDSLNETQISNLYQLGKTWGYLKYHSPEVSKGNMNWDYELFRFLPHINSKNFDALLFNWSRTFGAGIKTEIKENYYVDIVSPDQNPVFKNEEPYQRIKWDDTGMKILALFRYWNSINYFFPYKDIIGKNWDQILKDYIPKIIHTHDELSYKLTILELTTEIHDTHAGIYDFGNIIDEFYGIREAPLKTRFVDEQLVITDISKHNSVSGFSVGDIITEIDHQKVSDLLNEKAKYIPASNKASLLREISKIILKTNEDDIVLKIKKDNGEILDISSKTIPAQDMAAKANTSAYKELDPATGYINSTIIKEQEVHTAMEKFMNKKGIIIDLRGYPKQFTAELLSGYLYPEEKEFALFKITSLQHPGKFEMKGIAKIGKRNKNYYKGKIAILVDQNTQSASEFIAMALRTAPRSAVIGSQTAGTDGNVSYIDLPGRISTSMSGLGIYYPDGKDTQRTGISIDIQAKPTLQSIRKGEDLLIQKAVEFINQ